MRGPKLSFNQERQRRELRQALEIVLSQSKLVDFDDERFVGTHEDIDGVHWHVALDRAEMTSRFAVNLEGLAYSRTWPIARFLGHEVSDSQLLTVVPLVPGAESVFVHLTRDAWKGQRTRVAADKWLLLSKSLTQLREGTWRRAVAEAQGCLAGPCGGRGVASLIRVKTGAREKLETTPHLNVGISMAARGSLAERVAEMQQAVRRLTPIRDFIARRCV